MAVAVEVGLVAKSSEKALGKRFCEKISQNFWRELKKWHGWMPHHWKKILIFSVAAFAIPLLFGKIDLSAIIFLIVFGIFVSCAAVYIFAQTMPPALQKMRKKNAEKIHIYRLQ